MRDKVSYRDAPYLEIKGGPPTIEPLEPLTKNVTFKAAPPPPPQQTTWLDGKFYKGHTGNGLLAVDMGGGGVKNFDKRSC